LFNQPIFSPIESKTIPNDKSELTIPNDESELTIILPNGPGTLPNRSGTLPNESTTTMSEIIPN
jgi:hypothetical protein